MFFFLTRMFCGFKLLCNFRCLSIYKAVVGRPEEFLSELIDLPGEAEIDRRGKSDKGLPPLVLLVSD